MKVLKISILKLNQGKWKLRLQDDFEENKPSRNSKMQGKRRKGSKSIEFLRWKLII